MGRFSNDGKDAAPCGLVEGGPGGEDFGEVGRENLRHYCDCTGFCTACFRKCCISRGIRPLFESSRAYSNRSRGTPGMTIVSPQNSLTSGYCSICLGLGVKMMSAW